jgi:hypothetical protein
LPAADDGAQGGLARWRLVDQAMRRMEHFVLLQLAEEIGAKAHHRA